MANIIGGYDTGLQDTSLYLLGRDDKTGNGTTGHEENVYVNVSNGNLVINHMDAYLPSQGEDFSLLRTYNSRGTIDGNLSSGWNVTPPIGLEQITANEIRLTNKDTSQFRFYMDAATGEFRSVDGSGAYEHIIKGDFNYDALVYKAVNGTYSTTSTTVKNGYILTRADQSRLYFDGNGTLLQSQDTNGNVIQYEYQSNRLSQVMDDQGHIIDYVYNGADLVEIRDESGLALVKYTYASNRLATITDRDGHVTEYRYNTDGDLSSIVLPTDAGTEPRIITFEYIQQDGNSQNKLLQTIHDAEGNETRFRYDFVDNNWSQYKGGTTSMVDTLGINRSESNDTASVEWRLVNGYYATYDQRSYAEGLFLDGNGNYIFDNVRWASYRAQVDEIQQNHSVSYTYDSNGAITSVRQLKTVDGVSSYAYQTDYVYDADENLTAIIDANGYAITHSDDIYWRDLRRDYGYVDPLSGQGKLIADLSAQELAELKERYTTHFEYDDQGNLLQRIDNADNVTTFSYTDFNKLASETTALGHALASSDAVEIQQQRQQSGYALLAADLSAADQAALRELYTTHYRYDADQNLIEIESPAGDLTHFEYDLYGNVTKKIVYLDASDLLDPAKQQLTQYFYDAYGNNIKTIEANAWLITHSDADYWRNLRAEMGIVDGNNKGKWRAQITPQEAEYLTARFTSYSSYDHFGNRLSYTDANGGVTTYTYDDDNRLTTVTDPENNVTAYQYDAVGNRIGVSDANGHTVIYVYNKNNQLIAVRDPSADGDTASDRNTSFSYDVVGNRTAVVDAEGRETRYLYREDRRLLEVITPQVTGPDGALRTYSTSYAYDAVGQRISVNDNNGKLTQYVYHETGLLKQVTDAEGNVSQYRYDANLNQLQIIIGAQLSQEKRRVLNYRYDAENQLVAEVDAEGNTTSYGHDAVGNRIVVTDANGHSYDFEYDQQNRRIRETGPEVIDPLTGQPVRYSTEHYFDGKGNEIATTDANGHTTRFNFDQADRLVMVTDANNIQTVFSYDSRSNRTAVYIGVQAHLDSNGQVIIDDQSQAQAMSYRYDEFNQLQSRIDGVGNALAAVDSPLYQEMRRELGYVDANGAGKQAADLTAMEQAELRALYTERYDYDKVGNRVAVTDHLGRASLLKYDALDRLAAHTDALGNTVSYRYDGNGNRVAETAAMGHALVSSDDAYSQQKRLELGYSVWAAGLSAQEQAELLALYTTEYVYDGNNRLLETRDPQGVVTQRSYDNVGNLLSETRAAGTSEARTSAYEYDLNNRLVVDTNPELDSRSYSYDAVGNRLAVTDDNGGVTEFVYDALNRNIKLIDPRTFETRFEYDGVGNRLAIIDARGGVSRLEYDPGNRLLQTTDAEGRVSRIDYDVRGNRITQTTAFGTTDAEVTHFDYDAQNNLRSVTNAEGQITTHDYDRVYNRIATTDANGHTSEYGFDAVGRVLTVTDAAGGVTSYAYDADGNRLQVTDANGHVTTYDYDSRGQMFRQVAANGVATEYRYDAVGNRIELIQAAGTPDARHTSYVYDLNDRLIATISAEGNALALGDSPQDRLQRLALGYPAQADSLSTVQQESLRNLYTTRQEYDGNGNVKLSIDALGRTTQYSYDENNQLKTITDPLNGVTRYEYDASGNRVQVINALNETTTSYYNLNGELTHQVDAEGGMVAYVYDNNGNRITETRYATAYSGVLDINTVPTVVGSDADETRHYGYDKLNRLIRSVDAEGAVVDTRYDAVGNVSERIAYANTIMVDPAQPLAAQTPLTDSLDQISYYLYDANDRLLQSIDAEGYSSNYVYDEVGNRLFVTSGSYAIDSQAPSYDPAKAALAHPVTSGYEYDVMDRVVVSRDALGTETHYEYDALGNRTAVIEAAGTTLERRSDYRYDDNNRLIEIRNAEGTVSRYEYDAAGQRTGSYEAWGLAEQRYTEYVYDDLGRLKQQIHPDLTVTRYDYDALGNRTAVTDARLNTSYYKYDGNNRLVLFTDVLNQSTSYRYDAFGNQVQVTDARNNSTTSYYDRNNRLSLQVNAEGAITRYSYDAFGNRIGETRYATELALAADPGTLPGAQTAAADETRQYLYDDNNRLLRSVDAEGYVTDYRYDGLGNRVASVAYANAIDPSQPAASQTPIPDSLDREVSYQYDDLGRVLTTTDAEGYSSSYEYDVLGNQLAVTSGLYNIDSQDPSYDAAKAALAHPVTMAYGYDDMGRQISETNDRDVSNRYEYDALGNRTAVIQAVGLAEERSWQYSYDEMSRVVEEENPEGTITRYEYDELGRKTDQFVAWGLAEQRHTQYVYDDVGRLKQQIHPDLTVTEYLYDALGNQTARIDAAGTGDARQTSYVYDKMNRVTAQTSAANSSVAMTTRFAYDAFGNRIEQVEGYGSAEARTTQYTYDRNNRLIAQTDANDIVSRFAYDAYGNLTLSAITDRVSGVTQSTQMDYDGRNLVVSQTNGAGEISSAIYDAAGNLRSQTAAAGTSDEAVTTYSYDNLNRLTDKIIDPAGLAIHTHYEYDHLNNLIAERNGDGYTSRTEYDEMNRATLVTDGEGFSTQFSYDRFGNQTSIYTGLYLLDATDPSYDTAKAAVAIPAKMRFAYDVMNRQSHQVDALGIVTKFDYDLRGNQTTKTEAYGYLGANLAVVEDNITTIDAANASLEFAEPRLTTYSYDLRNRLTDETQPIGTVIHYNYNSLGDKTAKIVDYGSGRINATTEYFYDAAGRLAFDINPVGVASHYQYDDFGNLISRTEGLGIDINGQPSLQPTAEMRVTEFLYDGAGRVLNQTVDPDGLALHTVFEYDERGNRTATIDANGNRSEFVYDQADRLVWQRNAEGDVVTLGYDARGNTIYQHRYANSGTGLASGQLPTASDQDQISRYVYDGRGKMLQMSSERELENGHVVNRYEYDAFGNLLRQIDNATAAYGSEPRVTSYEYNLANVAISKWENLASDDSVINGVSVQSSYRFDALYNLVEETVHNTWLDGLNGDALTTREQTTRYRYDLNNRITDQIIDPTGLNIHTGFRYDALGNQIAEIDPNGNTTRSYYDAAGRATYTVDPLGHVREAQYDANGNVIKAIQYANAVNTAALTDNLDPVVVANAALDRSVEYVYDKAGREVGMRLDEVDVYVTDGTAYTSVLARPETSKLYDNVGNLLRETDANGYNSYHYYNSLGQEIGSINAEGYLSVKEYDAFGNLLSETLYMERQSLAEADKLNLDLASYIPGGEVRVTTHSYDLGNNNIRSVYPPAQLYIDGQETVEALSVERSYDAYGGLLSETVMHGVSEQDVPTKDYSYDLAGRIASSSDAQGKVTSFRYDAANNMIEQVEGSRVTNYEYDAANRNTAVHFPEYTKVEVAADGTVTTEANYRIVTQLRYDATGNRIYEERTDGTQVKYLYDQAGRKVGAIDNSGIYVEYGYNFAGDRTLTHRYYNLGDFNDTLNKPTEDSARDQVIEYGYDRLGRLISEANVGDLTDMDDDRVARYAYDAVSNQVQITGPRDTESLMFYDGLGQLIGSKNPSGSLTATVYDAEGNIIRREAGGWSAPTLVGGVVNQSLVSQQGLTLEWSTDRASTGLIQVRPAGSGAAWTDYTADALVRDHRLAVSGLAAGVSYEYRLVAIDPFGYTLTTDIKTFTTPVGVSGTTVRSLPDTVGGDHAAELSFLLAGDAQNIEVVVGGLGSSPSALLNEQIFVPVRQADGSYRISVEYATAEAGNFLIRWRDADGALVVTEAQPLPQPLILNEVESHLLATPNGGQFDLDVTWDLSQELAAGKIGTALDTGDYEVYISSLADNVQVPLTQKAVLTAGGIFQTTFALQDEGGRTIEMYYHNTDGEKVLISSLHVDALAGLDQRNHRLSVEFPDLDTTDMAMAFSYRPLGSTTWIDVPASALQGTSVDVTALLEGDYEYQAALSANGETIRTTSGSFSLRQLGEVTSLYNNPSLDGLVDTAQQPALAVEFPMVDGVLDLGSILPLSLDQTLTVTATEAVTGIQHVIQVNGTLADLNTLAAGDYTLSIVKSGTDAQGNPITLNDISGSLTAQSDAAYQLTEEPNLLSVAELFPLAVDDQGVAVESVELEVTDALGTSVVYELPETGFDLAVLSPGDYTVHIRKYALDPAGDTLLQDMRGELGVKPIELTNKQVDELVGARNPDTYNLDADATQTVTTTVGGSSTSTDRVYSYFDEAGRKIYSNENGGVWTRYFYDGQGNITKEVRFKISDTVPDFATRPSQTELDGWYDAALLAHDPANGVDTMRLVTRSFDASGNRTAETHQTAIGAVTDSWEHDRYGNVISENTADGGQISYTYDNMDRQISLSYGAFSHYDADNNPVHQAVSETTTYDGRGNKSSYTDANSNEMRYHYDAYGRLSQEWDARAVQSGFTRGLRTERVYDHFGRVESVHQYDLDPGANVAVHNQSYSYTQFDEVEQYTDALGYVTDITYDQAGNRKTVTFDNTFTERYKYDAENHVTERTDSGGYVWKTEYDAYGNKISETDPNGRVTAYTIGKFGQVSDKTISRTYTFKFLWFSFSYTDTYRETTTYDWLGQRSSVTDSDGKNDRFAYDQAGNLLRHQIQTLDPVGLASVTQVAEYTYDEAGRRTGETLTRGGQQIRTQSNSYNERGWLTNSQTDNLNENGALGVDGGLSVDYGYDAVGNRVLVNNKAYSYDANNRMLSAIDTTDTADATDPQTYTVTNIQYDGYGNRISEFKNNQTIEYTYDKNNRVKTSTAGDSWDYDSRGNTTRHGWEGGQYTESLYDNLGRSWYSKSLVKDEGVLATDASESWSTFDAAGNLTRSQAAGKDYGTLEITSLNIHYRSTAKNYDQSQSWSKGAAYLYGSSSYNYDVNGNLIKLDRGYNKDDKHNSIGLFSYDNEGKIIGKDESGGLSVSIGQAWTYGSDPSETGQDDSYSSLSDKKIELFGGQVDTWGNGYTGLVHSIKTNSASYLYSNGQSVGEVSLEREVGLKQIQLSGVWDAWAETPTAWVTIEASDIVTNPNGSINRLETARNIYPRVASGDTNLSATAKEAVLSKLAALLPDDISAGNKFELNHYVLVTDVISETSYKIIDNIYQKIGGDEGLPGGSAMSHTVNPGDTLQSISTAYFGSSSYWYLIAEANGLQGTEELKAGTSLSIPNSASVSSTNDKDTYKVYSQSEIIGSESPEVRVQKKKLKWYQKLVQVLLVILVVVALAALTAFSAGALAGPAAGAATGVLGSLGTAGAAFGVATGATVLGVVGTVVAIGAVGYVVGYAVGFISQTVEIAVDLREDYDWKAIQDQGANFAASAIAAGIGAGFNKLIDGAKLGPVQEGLYRALTEVSVQAIKSDGKVDNVAGVLGAALGLSVEGASKADKELNRGLSLIESVVEGDEFGVLGFIGDQANPNGFLNDAKEFDWSNVAQEALMAGVMYEVALNKYDGNTDAAAQVAGGRLGGKLASSGVLDSAFEKGLDWVASGVMAVGRSIRDAGRGVAQLGSDIVDDVAGMFDAPEVQMAGAGGLSVNGPAGKDWSNTRQMTLDPKTGQYVDQYGKPAHTMFAAADNGVMSDAGGGYGAIVPMGDGDGAGSGSSSDGSDSPFVTELNAKDIETIGSIEPTDKDFVQQVISQGDDAKVEDIKRMQQILVDNGIDIGTFGEWGDGVDGVVGDMTKGGAERFLSSGNTEVTMTSISSKPFTGNPLFSPNSTDVRGGPRSFELNTDFNNKLVVESVTDDKYRRTTNHDEAIEFVREAMGIEPGEDISGDRIINLSQRQIDERKNGRPSMSGSRNYGPTAIGALFSGVKDLFNDDPIVTNEIILEYSWDEKLGAVQKGMQGLNDIAPDATRHMEAGSRSVAQEMRLKRSSTALDALTIAGHVKGRDVVNHRFEVFQDPDTGVKSVEVSRNKIVFEPNKNRVPTLQGKLITAPTREDVMRMLNPHNYR